MARKPGPAPPSDHGETIVSVPVTEGEGAWGVLGRLETGWLQGAV